MKLEMNAGQRISEFLEKNFVTLELLSELTGYSVEQLRYSLENNSFEVRMIEKISRELRVPLYTFFNEFYEENRPNDPGYKYGESTLTRDQELRSLLAQTASEVQRLKAIIEEKERLIAQLRQKRST